MRSIASIMLVVVLAAAGAAVAGKRPAGVVALDWDAPDDRTSGVALEARDLGGYRIYYGSRRDRLDRVIDIKNPERTHYLVRGLEPGEAYYFAITAYDTAGRESPRSEPARVLAEAPEQSAAAASTTGAGLR